MGLVVDGCTYEAAVYAVEKWHYSRTLPHGRNNYFGVWENDAFIGTVIYGYSISPHLGKLFNLQQTEVTELRRVALATHEAPVTQMVAGALSLLKKKEKLKLVVSFADPNVGHVGTIYQAGNWIYDGDTNTSNKYMDRSGRIWHSRQVSTSGVRKQYGEQRKSVLVSECEILPQVGKHRYLYPLDKDTRKVVEKLRLPYPKNHNGFDTETVQEHEVEALRV